MISFVKISSLFCFILINIIGLSLAEILPGIEKCKAGDNSCIAAKINEIVRLYPTGNPSMGLPNFSEIKMNDLVVSKADPRSAIQLSLVLDPAVFKGIENATITRTVGFEKDPSKSKFEVYSTIPEITVAGKYRATGKVLLLPINGHGDMKLQFKNVQLSIKFKLNMKKENNLTYLVINKLKAKAIVEQAIIQADNLFDGNKEISDSMLRIINENWRDIWNEIEPGILNAIANIINTYATSFLSISPYEEFFID